MVLRPLILGSSPWAQKSGRGVLHLVGSLGITSRRTGAPRAIIMLVSVSPAWPLPCIPDLRCLVQSSSLFLVHTDLRRSTLASVPSNILRAAMSVHIWLPPWLLVMSIFLKPCRARPRQTSVMTVTRVSGCSDTVPGYDMWWRLMPKGMLGATRTRRPVLSWNLAAALLAPSKPMLVSVLMGRGGPCCYSA